MEKTKNKNENNKETINYLDKSEKNKSSMYNENCYNTGSPQALNNKMKMKKSDINLNEKRKSKQVKFKPNLIETVEVESYKFYNCDVSLPYPAEENKKVQCRCIVL